MTTAENEITQCVETAATQMQRAVQIVRAAPDIRAMARCYVALMAAIYPRANTNWFVQRGATPEVVEMVMQELWPLPVFTEKREFLDGSIRVIGEAGPFDRKTVSANVGGMYGSGWSRTVASFSDDHVLVWARPGVSLHECAKVMTWAELAASVAAGGI